MGRFNRMQIIGRQHGCSSWKDFLIPPKYQSTERTKTVIATKWNHSQSKQQKCAENLESKQTISISKEMQDFQWLRRGVWEMM